MELFNNDGHLTDEGLAALVQNALDEMGRLEAAEHLAFCDACLLRYTDLLSEETLMEPEKPQAPKIKKSLRSRNWRVAVGRYATVAAAACLAVAMWGVGTFAVPRAGRQAQDTAPPASQSAPAADAPSTTQADTENFSTKFSRFIDDTNAGLNGFLDRMVPSQNTSGTVQETQQERERRREEERLAAERQEKEKVFTRRSPAANQQTDPKDSGTSNP